MEIVAALVLFVESIQCRRGLLVILYGAVGHRISHEAELAEEDLPEEQIDPRVQDLVEGGQADRRQKKVTVQMDIPAGGVIGAHGCRIALVGGYLGGDHLQHQNLRRETAETCHMSVL